ncbi:MAG: hypothetical protein Q9M32_02425 [Sulfurimonas sp.]|nr:hypothetical protein [Sulfurimonas sp.]
MKLLNLITFLTVLLLTFSGCVGTSPSPSDKAVIDSTLPLVELSETGIFTDMKAIGFEWKSMKDPRVKGIYVYKKSFGEEESEYKFIDTIENRFVTHYIDEDVEPQSKYAYYFKTFTENSESNPSQETVVDTLPVLNSVSWIHAVENMPRSAKIIWRPHTNQIVKRYILERKTLEEDKWSELETIDGRLSAEYIDGELKDDFVYKYRIKVLTYNDITSKPSEEVKIVTKALPLSVSNIVATKNLPKQIKLTWDATQIKDFANYNVYRADSIDGSYKLVLKAQSLEFIDKLEEDGKDYFYRVSTVDKDGLESVHDIKSIHGKTLSKPITPSLVEVQMQGNSLELNWKSNSDRVKSFIVKKKSKFSWIDTSSEEFTDIKGTSFIDTTVAPETTYYYEVYSVDEFGIKSEPSIEVKYTTTKDEGKIASPKEDTAVQVKSTPSAPQDVQNKVQPIDDFDMSVR